MTVEQMEHPLSELLIRYFQEFNKLKEEHQDLDPITFNQEYGIYLTVPNSWPWLAAILRVAQAAAQLIVIYPTTKIYDMISETLESSCDVQYMTWHEIYTAMHGNAKDARPLKEKREQLRKAGLIIFVGANQAFSEVVDQVRAAAEGCLIILG